MAALQSGRADATALTRGLDESRRLRGITGNVLAVVAVLLALGIAMAGNAGVAGNPASARYFVLRHTLWVGVSIMALFVAYSIDYHTLRGYSRKLLVISLLSLAFLFVFGHTQKGATRWYRIGSFLSIQPSEFFKIALCLYMADFLAREQERIQTFFKGFLQPVIVMGVAFVLILLQPDFGTALLIATVTFGMLFVAGIRMAHVVPSLLVSLPLLYHLVSKVPYRWKRITTFLDPWSDPMGAGYQVIQSLLALGSGGVLGVGLGNSHQKLRYLPEAGNDFVFAIIGEELGLIGAGVVIVLFGVLVWLGMRIAVRAADLYGTLLAFGLALIIGLQAAVNIAVVTCSAPTKGLALPLVSSGGSSLMAMLIAVGLIMNVASHVEADATPVKLGGARRAGKR
ncbi:putative lipid II flippase FtsW [bacterium]|nr:putative lipid II flippase FtsW [bacterium]